MQKAQRRSPSPFAFAAACGGCKGKWEAEECHQEKCGGLIQLALLACQSALHRGKPGGGGATRGTKTDINLQSHWSVKRSDFAQTRHLQ
jgi:hypothetical protein